MSPAPAEAEHPGPQDSDGELAARKKLFRGSFARNFQDFTSVPPDNISWQWRGETLRDGHGHLLAIALPDVITIDKQSFLVEMTGTVGKFGMRATSGAGEIYTVDQESITVARLAASCSGRRYILERVGLFSRDRLVHTAGGALVMRVRPKLNGTVEVDNRDATADIPTSDAVVLSRACALVDGPAAPMRRA